MHASNLLKAVLKPQSLSGSSSGQKLSTRDSKSRGSRAAAPLDSALSLSVTKKSGLSPVPKPAPKMSCLCAPTNHAGSFRCRLHRASQQGRGGSAVVPAEAATSSQSTTATSSSSKPTSVQSRETPPSSRRVVQHQMPSSRPPMVSFAPAHRIADMPRPSRLSRVSNASDVDAPVPQVSSASASPPPQTGNTTVRYLKFNPGAAGSCGANASVIDGGMSFVKKLQTGGKDVMHEVFGSHTAMSRAALSL